MGRRSSHERTSSVSEVEVFRGLVFDDIVLSLNFVVVPNAALDEQNKMRVKVNRTIKCWYECWYC